MPRLTRFVIVCEEYETGEYTHLAQAERGLENIEREGGCTLPHHIENLTP
jgi:hypothetical protein